MVTLQAIEAVCDGDVNLLNYAWKQKKHGLMDSTIKQRASVLRQIKLKGCDLTKPETVEIMLAVEPLTKSQKHTWAQVYDCYAKAMKLQFEKPKTRYQPKQPFMPTYEEISALIHSANKQTATFLQVALTTGARAGEICKIQWTDVNTEKNTISINEAEKGSSNRTIPVPDKTIAMINALSKKYKPYVFNKNDNAFRMNLNNLKKRLSKTQQNPRFEQIHIHTFRHYFATEKLRQTKMLTHVQYLLGHKSVMNTERYTHLVDYSGEKYYSAVAKTVDEIRQLAEDGWTYFQEVDGIKIFRKPK